MTGQWSVLCPGCGGELDPVDGSCPRCEGEGGHTQTLTSKAGVVSERLAGQLPAVDNDPALAPTGALDLAEASTLNTPQSRGKTTADLGETPPGVTDRRFIGAGSADSARPSWRRISGHELPAVTADDDPLLGQTVAGRFTVEAFLGKGGMGQVYRAQQTAVDRPVVLKFLHNRQAEQSAVTERFHQEALAASKLQSPNTIVVHDFGQSDGRLYMAMEYLEGRTLSDELRRDGHFSPLRALAVALQVLNSLEEAHQKGIVHRDLKPDNIMLVRRSGTRDFVKVLDFGIAKMMGVGEKPMVLPDMSAHEPGAPLTDRHGPLTRQGEMFGSPGYMAPEQVMAGEVDGRTDLYALGVILYRMLCGTLPIKGKRLLQLLENTVAVTPKPPSRARTDVTLPTALDQLVMRCLHKDPEQRFASAAQMAAAIRAVTPEVERFVRDQEQALLELVGIRRRIPSWWRWAAAAAGGVLLVVFGLWFGLGGIQAEGETLAPGQRVFVSASATDVPRWVNKPAADQVVERMTAWPQREEAAQLAMALVVGRLADVPQRFDRVGETVQWSGELSQLAHQVGKLDAATVKKLKISVFWAQFAVGQGQGDVGAQYDVVAMAPRPDQATSRALRRHFAGLRHDRYSFLLDEAVRHRRCDHALELGVKITSAIKALDAKKPLKQRLRYLLKRKLTLCVAASSP